MAVREVRPGLTPTTSAPSTVATAGSGADQVTSAPTMGWSRESMTYAVKGLRSLSGTRTSVSSTASAAGT